VIPREELQIVAGISEWARRVRELRVEYGWRIYSGTTVSEMIAEDTSLIDEFGFDRMPADSYILLDETQDIESAYRWHVANDIRNTNLGVRNKILKYLRINVGKPVTGEELRYVSKDRTEWARRTRELRTEYGWPIATKQSGRPDLPTGVYLLEEDRQSPEHDRRIPDLIRGKVLRRDEYRCRRCAWHHELNNPSDPRHLELHHIMHHAAGGENTEANLITLCTRCHDEWHGIADSTDFDSWLRNR
jgi:hypothetical protein